MSSGFEIDLVEILFTLFWIFFIGLVFYLHRESKREGYPLVSDFSDSATVQGFPAVPAAKEYRLAHGGTALAPSHAAAEIDVPGVPAAKPPGSPLIPSGDPIGANIGPGSYAHRSDTPILSLDGRPRIVPLRTQPQKVIDSRDPDPRGMPLIAADGVEVGRVSDVWIDIAEPMIIYLEVAAGERSIIVPFDFTTLDKGRGIIRVNALNSYQFADVPALRSPDQITAFEEDRIVGYFGSGLMYADAARQEPLL